jgi:hypothetical protein
VATSVASSVTEQMAGRKPKYLVAGKWMLRVAGLFNPLLRELVEMNYLLTNPVLMDDTSLQNLSSFIHPACINHP